ncbi:hypothetical protein F503_00438 [Ophiostoma piceae UAMH 11346]|uniref:Uncharacterized protein n=1 Tax=Ophiostoma piceae (strain UAMH 11346) TaxID=1262450 RepID=S3C752_OPHP1|nr:hypothetical protein F503_00438 [Ophiostoma piceae UAMH 11346]
MIYQGSEASPGARTNGSPLPKRRNRRDGVGARATITHDHPYGLRGGAVPSVRRLRSEPMRKDDSFQYGSGAMSPTRLSPTAANWVPQRFPTATPTQSPAAGRANRPPLLSYAAVAKLSQYRPLLAPLPPPPCPIATQPSRGNANRRGAHVRAAGRPAAKTDNTNGAGVRGAVYKIPERRDALSLSESTDGGALLVETDTEMVCRPNADPPSVLDKGYRFNLGMKLETVLAVACPRTTPAKAYKAEQSMFAGVKVTTPNKYGCYSPVRGQAARLSLDESPFFPKSLLEYSDVVAETSAEARARDRIQGQKAQIRPCHGRNDGQSTIICVPTAYAPGVVPGLEASKTPQTASRDFRETEKKIPRSPWSLGGCRYEECEPENAYDGYSSTLHKQARIEIKYEDLDGGMRDLFDYIDSPET